MSYLRRMILLTLWSASTLATADERPQARVENPSFSFYTERLPEFPLDAWASRQTGPRNPPYFLQDQLYHLHITSPVSLDVREKKMVTARLYDADRTTLLQTFHAKMKPRGSSSMHFPKKQHALDIVSPAGKKESLAILDMPASPDWILAAPYNDKSLVRDLLSFNLANLMGRYASRTRIVTVSAQIGDEPEQAMGLYVITEKSAKIHPSRINIPKKSADGQTAFLLEIDRIKDDFYVTTQSGLDVIVKYPDVEELTAAYQDALLTHLNDIEGRLARRGTPAYAKLFDERLDLDSAVDFFIAQELSRNIDAYRLSSPMYIPPGGKLYFGPIWDFNLAYGNANYEGGWLIDGWQATQRGIWFKQLMEHPVFCQRLQDKWQAYRAQALSNNSIFEVIDRHVQIMAPAVAENFDIWGGLGTQLWPNPYWLDTHEREVDALKSWIALRTEWMDQAIDSMICR